MKKHAITSLVTMGVSLLMASWVQAATVCDVKANLGEARAKLVEMLGTSDKAQQEELKKGIEESSTALETALDALLQEGVVDKAKLTQFQEIWVVFKETRNSEIIPAIQSGDVAAAKQVATTIQADRVKAMGEALQALDGDKCETDKK